LLQQAVDERGLAVVDVGNDGDVSKVHRLTFCVWSCKVMARISV
jgi:hypothetical protein